MELVRSILQTTVYKTFDFKFYGICKYEYKYVYTYIGDERWYKTGYLYLL